MRTTIKVFFLISIGFVFLISCKKENDNKKDYKFPVFVSGQSEFTDDELLNAAYTDYKYPIGFNVENLGDTTIYYVNTVSIDSLNKEKWIELSTNSYSEAYYWCEKTSPVGSIFKRGVQSEKFIEYIRTYNPSANTLQKLRAHKKTYFSRDNIDLMGTSDTIGVFEKDNFTMLDAKELIDYLWFVKNYYNSSSKMLSSFGVDNQDKIEIYHYEILIVYGDFDLSDRITLLEKVYGFEKESGLIIVSETTIRSINGEPY